MPARQIGGERARALRVVRGVEQNRDVAGNPDQLEPSPASRPRQPTLDCAPRQRQTSPRALPRGGGRRRARWRSGARRAARASPGHSGRRACRTMIVARPSSHVASTPCVPAAASTSRAPALRGDSGDDVAGASGSSAGDDGHARLDDAGLLERNRLERVAEVLLMVEADRRDGAGDGGNDVGRVEAAAQADFDDRRPRRRARRNSSNAIAVVASKNVGWTGSSPVGPKPLGQVAGPRCATAASVGGVDTGAVPMTKRSVRSTGAARCIGRRGCRPRPAPHAPSR